MKLLISTLLLFVTMLFVGCSDDMSDEYYSLIAGEWIASEDSEAYPDFHFELRFATDKTVQFLMQDKLDSNYDTMDESNYGFNEYGTYTIDDDELYVETDNLWYKGTIKKLNSSSLSVKRSDVDGNAIYDYFIKQ